MLNVVWIKSYYRMVMTYPRLENLRSFVTDMFLNDIITYDIIVLMFT